MFRALAVVVSNDRLYAADLDAFLRLIQRRTLTAISVGDFTEDFSFFKTIFRWLRRMRAMNSLFIQIAALTSSFLLAMPAGWCVGWMPDSAASAPAVAACCQPSCHDPAADPLEVPVSPTVDCCCSWDATMPQKGVELNDSSSFAAAFAAANVTPHHSSAKLRDTVSKPVRYGPRLHVLQCVWRC